jgi:uncharacterized protein
VINPSFHLYQLQKIDLKIDAITKRLSEIDRIRNDNSTRKVIEESFAGFKKLLREQKMAYAEIEEKVQSKKIKIDQSEASLYGGTIKNPKELQDLQAEIRSLKQSKSNLEDEQLQQLMTLESTEKDCSDVEKSLSDFDAQLEIQYATLFAEEAVKKTELEKIMQERKAILDQIIPDNLLIYQSLRKTKNGIALSTIEEGCCAVCGSTLTPADCQTAKSPLKMATCSSCGRILYAG